MSVVTEKIKKLKRRAKRRGLPDDFIRELDYIETEFRDLTRINHQLRARIRREHIMRPRNSLECKITSKH